MKDTVLIALGNALMTDEGVGCRVLGRIEAGGTPDGVVLLDLGTNGFAALHAITGRKRAVFVDCAFMGEPPGTMRGFSPEEVRTRKVRTRGSAHAGDLLDTLALARRIGNGPEHVVIFGIEPARVEPGTDLSEICAARLDDYARVIRAELERSHA